MRRIYSKIFLGILLVVLCASSSAASLFSVVLASTISSFPSQVLGGADIDSSYYATYAVTNTMSIPSSVAFVSNNPLITQVSSGGENNCASVTSLAPNGICHLYLKLTIPAGQVDAVIAGGPVVCRSASYPVACNQAVGVNAIHTTVSHALLTFGIDQQLDIDDPYYEGILVTNNTAVSQTITNLATDDFYSNVAFSDAKPKVDLTYCRQGSNCVQRPSNTLYCVSGQELSPGGSCTLLFSAGGPASSASALTITLETERGGVYTHQFYSAFSPAGQVFYAGGFYPLTHSAGVFTCNAENNNCSTDGWTSVPAPSSPASYEIHSLAYDQKNDILYAGGTSQSSQSGAFTGVVWSYANGSWQTGVSYQNSMTVNALLLAAGDLYVGGSFYPERGSPSGFVNDPEGFHLLYNSYEINGLALLDGVPIATGSQSDSSSQVLTQHFWVKSCGYWRFVDDQSIPDFNVYSMISQQTDDGSLYLGGNDGERGVVVRWFNNGQFQWLPDPPSAYEIRGLGFYGDTFYAVGTQKTGPQGSLVSHLWVYNNNAWVDKGNPWSNFFVVMSFITSSAGGFLMTDPSVTDPVWGLGLARQHPPQALNQVCAPKASLKNVL